MPSLRKRVMVVYEYAVQNQYITLPARYCAGCEGRQRRIDATLHARVQSAFGARSCGLFQARPPFPAVRIW